MKRSMLMVGALVFLSILVYTNSATADLITVSISSTQVATMDGRIIIDGLTDKDQIIRFTGNVKEGQTASQIASGLCDSINSQYGGVAYHATQGTQTLSYGQSTITLITVTISPIKGGIGRDFVEVDQEETSGVNFYGPADVKVNSAGPGTTSLNLIPSGAPGNNTKFIDWNLFVVGQNDVILGESLLANVPDTTGATSLIDMFAADLLNQGIPVVANGTTLNLTSNSNDYFVVENSVAGSLEPVLSDTVVVPELSTLVPFGIGAVGLLGYAWRRRKQVA
jgi:hypothetical protein